MRLGVNSTIIGPKCIRRPKMKKLSLIIPEELFDTIEAMSIEQDLSISGVIVNLIEKALKPIEIDVTELIIQNRNVVIRGG